MLCNICLKGPRTYGCSCVAEMREGLGEDGGPGLPEPGTNLLTSSLRKRD